MIVSDRQSSTVINPLKPWIIWGIAGLFFFYQFMVRVSPGVIEDVFRADLGMSRSEFGAIAAYYYVGYTLMQIPTGIMLDQLGVRRLLITAALLCGVGCYLFATALASEWMSIGRLLMGIGSAFGFLSCVKVATLWFRPERLGFIIGIAVFLGPIGGVFGGYPLAHLVQVYGWKTAILVLSAIGSFLAFAAFAIVKDRKSNVYTDASDELTAEISIRESLKIILSNPQTYVFALYGALIYTFLSGFADLWGTSFMIEAYGVSKQEASRAAVSCFYLGIAIGGPLTAWIAQKDQSYKRSTMIGSILCLLLVGIVIYLPHYLSFQIATAILFVLGLVVSTQFLAFSSVCEINPVQINATASAVHNMMCMLTGVGMQWALGYLIDTRVPEGTEASVQDYQYALSLIMICLLLSVVTTFFMKETFPRDLNSSQEDK